MSTGKKTDYYTTLEIERHADHSKIKQAYRRMAFKHHPDRNLGNETKAAERFKAISEAYDVLSDPEKRKLYDSFGSGSFSKANIPAAAAAATANVGFDSASFSYRFNQDPNEMFANFLKRSFQQQGSFEHGSSIPIGRDEAFREGPTPNRVVTHALALSLEALYLGKVKKMKIYRKNLTLQRPTEVVVEVPIRPGFKAGTKIRYENFGDEIRPGVVQDIVFIIQEKKHPRFRRDGDDLHYHARVPLVDALTGFTLDIEALDKRILRCNLHDVVSPSYTKVISGFGMPNSKNPSSKGDLIVTFDVVYPRTLTTEQKRMIRLALNKDKMSTGARS